MENVQIMNLVLNFECNVLYNINIRKSISGVFYNFNNMIIFKYVLKSHLSFNTKWRVPSEYVLMFY